MIYRGVKQTKINKLAPLKKTNYKGTSYQQHGD